MRKTLDLGCGPSPKNPFGYEEVYGIDLRKDINPNIHQADLAIESIPFKSNYFDAVSAHDFIEHIPRVLYVPKQRYGFVELMNEIYRVLKVGGLFYSFTPAYPAPEVFRDPTHVNVITEETFPFYFDDHHRLASVYGFNGFFKIEEQKWHDNKIHLITTLRKLARPTNT
ncbi:class I SAM-dependent methyltransferase [Polynucleobacter paneuropaeus]|nr:class I SAM-dependent methyltransferase [Polynucleobacter paneuropaeus]